ncbi:MAG: G-D-S-L family lipolytic protein [Planctomycetes bacterium]|nr:G-D-S-L family lipolytic protein [Planctomycetota bacterium]
MSIRRLYATLGIFALASFFAVQSVPQTASGQAKAANPPASAPAGGAYRLPAAFKLVCIGDSITQGRKGKGDAMDRMTYSWRYPLWKMFVDENIQVDFVGSLSIGFNGDADWADYKGKKFDRDHEGHWGWTTAAVAEKLPGWIEKYTPDAAMILLGSNDKAKDKGMDPTIQAYTSIIETLRKKNPNVLILIGPPFQEWEPFPAMRKALEELAGKLTTKQSPIVIVDLSKDWVSDPKKAGTCTADWVHPNEKGDEQLAKKWFEGIKPFLAK